MRPEKRVLFACTSPFAANLPTVVKRAQARLRRFDFVCRTQRFPTLRPTDCSATVNTTRDGSESVYLIVVPLWAAAATGTAATPCGLTAKTVGLSDAARMSGG